MSIAKVIVNGVPKGTAWLVQSQHVVTAAHCVDAEGSPAKIQFFNQASHAFEVEVDATVVRRNLLLDAALLRLAAPRLDLAPLQVSKAGTANSHPDWNGAGFPAAGEGVVGIFGFGGSVAMMHTAVVRAGVHAPAIQLTCDQAMEQFPAQHLVDAEGRPIHVLAGISGSAVLLPGRAERVLGIVRCSTTPLGAGTIFATSIEAIWAEFSPLLPGVVLHEWSRTSGSIHHDAVRGLFVSDIDAELVAAAWKDDVVKDITVDLPWEPSSPLVPAVLRLVLHQPGIARLHVRTPAAWNERLRRYADSWIVLEQFNPNERAHPGIECAHPNTDNGSTYPTAAALANAIHAVCDKFVLEQLHDRLSVMFEAQQPGDYANFLIAPDVLAQMSATWATWRAQLQADPPLLHHFFSLMLTHHGAHDCAVDASPGAGPLLLWQCIFPATVFALAVAPFLPVALDPKRPQPGNIGQAEATGHACGIAAIKRQKLDSGLRGHQWATQVVLLRNLDYMPDAFQAATGNLLGTGRAPRPTLSRTAPSALIIACDVAIREAIGTGVEALRAHLAARHAQQLQVQQDYAANAFASA